jgi:DNA-binding MarR family transcriptional regulator
MKPTDPFTVTLQEGAELIMRGTMRSFFQYVKGTGLSMPQIGALLHLTKGGTVGISNLSDDLGVSNAATSQMLDRLVAQGLILRSEDPDDRRVKKIVLTDKGRKTVTESLNMRQAWLEELAGSLSPAEKEQIITAIKILIAKASQIDQPSP